MFDFWCWPAYAMSINQMRSAKFNDRLDLLFIDFYNFYEIVSENPEISEKTITEIWRECKLARAYIFPHTFYWLRSFGGFKNFICSRKLDPFLEEKGGRPVEWGNSRKGFDEEYFDKLIEKVKQYKNGNVNGGGYFESAKPEVRTIEKWNVLFSFIAFGTT